MFRTAAILAVLCFAQPIFAQAGVPYVVRYGQRDNAGEPFKSSGVFWGEKRVAQKVDGQDFYQPFDFVLPVTNPDFKVAEISRWTDGREWISAWRFTGRENRVYSLTFDATKEGK